jgi:2-keto-4-pentenoate hydratase/2-oxohepta-3-ene-1,7-dioic acid hydratase in catechol pathway
VKLTIRRTYLGDRLCFPGLVPDRLVDVQAAYACQLEKSGAHREDAIARSRRAIAPDLPDLLQADPGLTTVRQVFERAGADGDSLPEDCTWSGDGAVLGPPVGRPATVWGMTGNYPRSRQVTPEGRSEPPRNATGFLKASGSLAGAYDDLRYPAISHQVEPELELAVVVGKRSHGLTVENAMDAVAGYVTFCDVSARDINELDNRRLDRGKGFDTFGIVGPWFVTADEIPDPHRLHIRYWVNGELRQDGSTAEMFRSIPEQLAWLTSALTLVPGDVLSTGTPPGVGSVQPGDKLRGEIEGLGVIANTVVPAP